MLTDVYWVFEDRATEIDSLLQLISEEEAKIPSMKTLTTLKASFFIMLYNLVEYTIQRSFLNIYDYVYSKRYDYSRLSRSIKNGWIDVTFSGCYDTMANLDTYKKKTIEIADHVMEKLPVKLTRKSIGFSGNIDADTIKKICDRYGIVIGCWAIRGECLQKVKEIRNSLSHWTYSFSEVWRNFTSPELRAINDECTAFMRCVLGGIDDYCKKELFLEK